MNWFRLIVILGLVMAMVAEDSDGRTRRRRRRGRSKIYSPPSKFELQDRKAAFEIKKDKLVLTHESGKTEEPVPFQTNSDKVAGMAYIPMGGRHFIQVVIWVIDVKGNFGSATAKPDSHQDEISQLLYWDLYEVVGTRIIWRQHQLLDQFIGQMDQELPPHLENAIQLALDENGRVFFKRGAVEQFINSD